MLYDAAILGCGSMGSAAALALARRGASVLALDQASVPNAIGEHSGSARMFRSAYFEHPSYVPLLRRARELWLDLNRQAGRTLYHETGSLSLGPEGSDLIERSALAAARFGLPHERIPPADLARRFPQFSPPPGTAGLLDAHAGVLTPEAAIAAMAALAREAGATIGTHEPVLGVHPEGDDRFTVVSERARYTARAVVVTAGAWTARLLRASGLPTPAITASRQPLGWFTPAAEHQAAFAIGRHPCWAFQDEPGSLLYGFPCLPGDPAFRVARHRVGPLIDDPDTLDRAVTDTDRADFEPAIPRLLPAAGRASSAAVAFYSNSPDGHFILDRLPGTGIVIAGGFSGHGFKFAPVVGEVVADLVGRGATSFDLSLFALGRRSPA